MRAPIIDLANVYCGVPCKAARPRHSCRNTSADGSWLLFGCLAGRWLLLCKCGGQGDSFSQPGRFGRCAAGGHAGQQWQRRQQHVAACFRSCLQPPAAGLARCVCVCVAREGNLSQYLSSKHRDKTYSLTANGVMPRGGEWGGSSCEQSLLVMHFTPRLQCRLNPPGLWLYGRCRPRDFVWPARHRVLRADAWQDAGGGRRKHSSRARVTPPGLHAQAAAWRRMQGEGGEWGQRSAAQHSVAQPTV